jgi:biotin carboxyl carrier protein
VEAPRAGKVKEIKVAEGQTVQEGDTVAVLD